MLKKSGRVVKTFLNVNSDKLKYDNKIELNMGVILIMFLLFLLFNPFLSLFIISILSVNFKIPKIPFVVFATISFTLIYFLREYGVSWAASSDDVPSYIYLFNSNASLQLSEIFTRFLSFPGGNEPIWHSFFSIFLNVFGINDNTFVFIHYFLIIFLFFIALINISRKYCIVLALAYFFLTPLSLDSVFHIWRQQLAFSVFLIGIAIYLIQEKKSGLYFIFLSPLMHLVTLFFVISFILFNWLKKTKLISSKLGFILFVSLTCLLYVGSVMSVINLFSMINLDRVTSYFESGGGDYVFRSFIISSFFMAFFFITNTYFYNDNFNKYIILVNTIIAAILFAFPSAFSIFTRLNYFAMPLVSVYLVRWYLFNFSAKWIKVLVFIIFITGMLRIIPSIAEKSASVQFLAYGHPLDPFMGFLKMLFFV